MAGHASTSRHTQGGRKGEEEALNRTSRACCLSCFVRTAFKWLPPVLVWKLGRLKVSIALSAQAKLQAGRREGMLQQVDCSPAVNSIFWLSKCEAWLGCKPPADAQSFLLDPKQAPVQAEEGRPLPSAVAVTARAGLSSQGMTGLFPGEPAKPKGSTGVLDTSGQQAQVKEHTSMNSAPATLGLWALLGGHNTRPAQHDPAQTGGQLVVPLRAVSADNKGPRDVIGDDDWENCSFSDLYRQPKAGSLLGQGATAYVSWVEKLASSPLTKASRAAVKEVPMLDLVKINNLKQEHRALHALQGSTYTVLCLGLHPEEPQPGGTAFLVMGLAEGKDVQHICECLHEAAQRLDKAKLDKLKAWVWEFGMQMACFLVQACGHMHDEGLFHRDLKLESVMVKRASRSRLLKGTVVDWASSLHYGELLKSLMGQEVEVSGCQGDMWAVGVMLTMIFTCTNPDWQLPFQPTAEDLQAMEALPDQDGVATALREAILRQQALWGRVHAGIQLTDGVYLGPDFPHLLGGITQAAQFAAKGHDSASSMARVSGLLVCLLHPDLDRRLHASQVTSDAYPWFWEGYGSKMPRSPVELGI